jgi:hypothetical protein
MHVCVYMHACMDMYMHAYICMHTYILKGVHPLRLLHPLHPLPTASSGEAFPYIPHPLVTPADQGMHPGNAGGLGGMRHA